MKLSKKPLDAAWLALFDTGEMQHVHYLITSGERPSLLQLVAEPLRESIRRIFESGRGTSASEYDAVNSFLSCAETTAKILAMREGMPFCKVSAMELADTLQDRWKDFIVHAGAYRMYHDLPMELVKAKVKSDKGREAVERRYKGKPTVDDKVKAEWIKLADRPEHERASIISTRTGIHVVTVRKSIKEQGLRKTKP